MASRFPRVASLWILGAALCAPATVSARSKGMKAQAAGDISIDGVPQEWDGEWRDVTESHKGAKPDRKDLSGSAIVAYGDDGIYVAADVKDDTLTAGRDHVELMLGVPGGTLVSFALYPGAPGKSRARVNVRGRPVSGAQIVEAPSDGGYTLEALIPWSAVPKSDTIRVGYRGGVFFHDADGGSVKNIMGTADSRSYRELPPISTESELALGTGLLRQRNITQAPRYNILANVVGDGMLERILVYDRFVVVLGPGYRDGEQYYFRDLGADADEGGVPTFEVKDFTGDGKADMLVKKRVTGEHGAVEVMEILSYHAGAETPDAVFAQETALKLDGGSIVNDVTLSGSGSRTTIMLGPGKADGIDTSRFERESSTGATPVLLPWGSVASQTWRIQGNAFALVDEQSRAPSAPEPPSQPVSSRSDSVAKRPRAAPRPSPRASRGADVDKVYALYKKQRGARGKPSFDMTADLAEDNRQERLLVHGRDLVVMGDGYRGGRGFAAVTLAQFDGANDITSVTTRDVSGDGKDEIVVKGIIRSPLPADVGNGVMARTVVMIYKLKDGGSFDRVFAAEIERQVDKKRVVAKLAFKSGSHRIELRPGRAVGYDERSYPWTQKKVPDQDFEPLLLPWGGVESVRLRYDGDKFVRL
jgi:hypothetical protein